MDNKETPKKTFSRRKFFTRAGIGLAGTMALLYFGRSPIRRKISGVAKEMDLPSGVLDFDTDLWFEVNPDNTITLKSPKVEMGQGIFTGFAMLAAEELDISACDAAVADLYKLTIAERSCLDAIIDGTRPSQLSGSRAESD